MAQPKTQLGAAPVASVQMLVTDSPSTHACLAQFAETTGVEVVHKVKQPGQKIFVVATGPFTAITRFRALLDAHQDELGA